jgi:hypothetical protein
MSSEKVREDVSTMNGTGAHARMLLLLLGDAGFKYHLTVDSAKK